MKVWICTEEGYDYGSWDVVKVFSNEDKAKQYTHDQAIKKAIDCKWSNKEINQRIDQKGEKLGFNYFEMDVNE